MSIEQELAKIRDTEVGRKFVFLAKAVEDLLTWYNSLDASLLWYSAISPSDPTFRTDLQNTKNLEGRLNAVLTSMAGQVSGYHKELELAVRQMKKTEFHGSGQTRGVHFGVRGDVAVDYGLGFGKAIQSKSSFSADKNAINQMLRVAANQLTGERSPAETPGSKDRRIVDVTIKNDKNPWPETSFSTPTTLEKVRQTVDAQVRTYKPHAARSPGKGYTGWMNLDLELDEKHDQSLGDKRRSRLTSGSRIGRDFVVKIRWDTPRTILIERVARSVTQITTRTQVRYLPHDIWRKSYLETRTDVLFYK